MNDCQSSAKACTREGDHDMLCASLDSFIKISALVSVAASEICTFFDIFVSLMKNLRTKLRNEEFSTSDAVIHA